MGLQVNPMELISMIRSGQNPQQLIMNILNSQMGDTPMGQNLINLAQTNNTQDLEKIARNMCASKGLDFDKEFMAFRKMLGM